MLQTSILHPSLSLFERWIISIYTVFSQETHSSRISRMFCRIDRSGTITPQPGRMLSAETTIIPQMIFYHVVDYQEQDGGTRSVAVSYLVLLKTNYTWICSAFSSMQVTEGLTFSSCQQFSTLHLEFFFLFTQTCDELHDNNSRRGIFIFFKWWVSIPPPHLHTSTARRHDNSLRNGFDASF